MKLKYMKAKFALVSVALIVLFSTATFSQTVSPAEQIHAADEAITNDLRRNGVKYETKRTILWVEKDSLTQKEIEDFGTLVNQGIVDIEKYTGIKFDKRYYQTEKMEYFISGKSGISRGSTDNKPYIYLASARVKEKKVPYLHETAHKIAYKSLEALWLAEGYAIYIQTQVANRYGGYDSNPFNPENADVDRLAKNLLKTEISGKLLPLIGLNGIPAKMNAEQREVYRPIFEDRKVTAPAFYNLSVSFVKFLITRIGVKKLGKAFDSADTRSNILKVTGKKVDEWKADWLRSLAGQPY
jgi:hypothetical protein